MATPLSEQYSDAAVIEKYSKSLPGHYCQERQRQRQESEEGQSSAQVGAKKSRTRSPKTVAEKAREDGNQKRHKQEQTCSRTNATAPSLCIDARLECYTLNGQRQREPSVVLDTRWASSKAVSRQSPDKKDVTYDYPGVKLIKILLDTQRINTV